MKPKEEPKPQQPKVEELKFDPSKAKSVKIEEASESDSDDDAEALKKLQQKKKTKQIDKETLDAAKAKAAEIDKQQAMAQVPKTAAGFEKDFNALKKDKQAL